ncbi:SDR family oxidoreductase, partial [Mesorhizobium sp. M1A.F.Ca.IN.020.06.1.1]
MAEELSGGVDILVNNAGLFSPLSRVPFEQLSNDEWKRVMDVNVFSIFIGCKAIVPLMRKRGGGGIVNISSASVYKGPPNLMHYVTSKAAVTMMTQVMARELGGDNIRANSVAPGFTLSDGVLGRKDPIEWQKQMNNNARSIKRDQMPEDIVGAVRFLCSPESAFITGQALV